MLYVTALMLDLETHATIYKDHCISTPTLPTLHLAAWLSGFIWHHAGHVLSPCPGSPVHSGDAQHRENLQQEEGEQIPHHPSTCHAPPQLWGKGEKPGTGPEQTKLVQK